MGANGPNYRVNKNKKSGLPLGISETWRVYQNKKRRPYFEYLAHYADKNGKPKTKHFYVSTDPTLRLKALVLEKAVQFRLQYEDDCDKRQST